MSDHKKPPVLIALETATEGCSVAVAAAGTVVERADETPRGHTARLLPMLTEAMAEAGVTPGDVDAVVFGRGPGAFTGVRLAASAAQALCLAWSVPAVGVSTLAALAYGAHRRTGADRIIAVLDARMDEAYWGRYRSAPNGAGLTLMEEERVGTPEEVPRGGGDWFGAGRGFAAFPERLPPAALGCDPDALPLARDLIPPGAVALQAGEGVDAAAALPLYLRSAVHY